MLISTPALRPLRNAIGLHLEETVADVDVALLTLDAVADEVRLMMPPAMTTLSLVWMASFLALATVIVGPGMEEDVVV